MESFCWHSKRLFFIWMVAMLIIINKQKKALAKEKIKTQEEEIKKKEVISLKDQLEVSGCRTNSRTHKTKRRTAAGIS